MSPWFYINLPILAEPCCSHHILNEHSARTLRTHIFRGVLARPWCTQQLFIKCRKRTSRTHHLPCNPSYDDDARTHPYWYRVRMLRAHVSHGVLASPMMHVPPPCWIPEMNVECSRLPRNKIKPAVILDHVINSRVPLSVTDARAIWDENTIIGAF